MMLSISCVWASPTSPRSLSPAALAKQSTTLLAARRPAGSCGLQAGPKVSAMSASSRWQVDVLGVDLVDDDGHGQPGVAGPALNSRRVLTSMPAGGAR